MAKTEEELAAGKIEQEKAVKQAKMKALQAAMSKIEKDFGKRGGYTYGFIRS